MLLLGDGVVACDFAGTVEFAEGGYRCICAFTIGDHWGGGGCIFWREGEGDGEGLEYVAFLERREISEANTLGDGFSKYPTLPLHLPLSSSHRTSTTLIPQTHGQ